MQYLLTINNFLSTKRNIFGARDVYNTYRLERFRYRLTGDINPKILRRQQGKRGGKYSAHIVDCLF